MKFILTRFTIILIINYNRINIMHSARNSTSRIDNVITTQPGKKDPRIPY